MEWDWPSDADVAASLPGYRPTTKGHPRMIKEAAKLILASERPVIYAGGGILKARAAEELRELAELTGIHVVTTLMARGAIPDDHPLTLGMPGMHGNATAVASMQRSDLLITLGARFDDRITGRLDGFAPDAKIIHVDIDPAEQGKVRRPDVPIVGDCKAVITEMIVAIKDLTDGGTSSRPTRRVEEPHLGLARAVPADVRAERARRGAQAAVLPREAARCGARGHDPGVGRRPAPDVGVAVLEVQRAVHVGELRWAGHDGLLDPGGDRRQGRPARAYGVGRRRRRLLPDDRPGARDRDGRADPDQGRAAEQQLSRHGPPVAGDVLRRAVLRGVPVARHARLRPLGGGDGLRRHPRRVARGGRAGDREGELDQRPVGRRRVPRRLRGEGVPDGPGRHEQRRARPAADPAARTREALR